MMIASDFRAIARDALRGQWLRAVCVGFLAALLGANIFSGSSVTLSDSETELISSYVSENLWHPYQGLFIALFLFLGLFALVMLIIGGAVTLGYARYNLDLVDFRETGVDELFSQMDRIGDGFAMQFFRGLYTLLWSLLFIIPGIIAQYRYSMAPYILAENPGMTAGEAITRSKEMMVGNKFRLFCLELSFIGWYALCVFPPMLLMLFLGWNISFFNSHSGLVVLTIVSFLLTSIGHHLLRPYVEASRAAFYREVSGTGYGARQTEQEALPYQMV